MPETKKVLFEKILVKTMPDKDGWYDTDKGNLYWFVEEQSWSCRDDRVSDEYPTYWLKKHINK